MNWFLLLLILKLFTTNWSAPIDLVENREEFQQDLDNLINKGFSVADEANNLLHTSEALVNGTVNAFNSSAVNDSLNENLHKVEEDLHKFSSELQKELQKDSTQDAIEVSFEQKPNEEEVSAQVTEISSFDGAAKKEGVPTEVSTKHVEEILTNTESRSEDLNLTETPEAAQDLNGVKVESSDNLANQSQYSIGNTQQESSSTEQQSFQYPSSTSINDAQEASVPETHEEKAEEVSSTITSTEHQNEQLPHSSTEDITQQAATEGSSNLEHSENSKDSTHLKETVDTLANDLLNIASMVQTSTESSDVADAHENVNVSETITEEHSERTPSFREAVDSFIEDIVEIGSKLGLTPEQTSEQPSIANQDSQNVEEIQTSSVHPIESSTEQYEQNTEYPLPNTNNDDSQVIIPEVQPISDAVESSSVTAASEEANGEESSTETPALKETVDSFINQVANIGSSLGETAKEIIDNAAMIKPEADNSSNSVLNNEASANLEHTESQNPEETHEKVPTFKDAVDAFIEDVVEIGSKLGLVPEEKPAEGAVPETTEQENKTAESTAASDLNVSNSNVEETTDKAEEITPTTLSPMDSLNENQQENIPKADENTEYSNFGRSADTLIQAASEIGNNFSEAVSNLFSLSDNPQETVAEIQNETATEIATPEEQNKTNDHQTDSEASSTFPPIENNVEISSTTESLPQAFENKQETENVHVPEAENSSDQIAKESLEEPKPKEEVKSTQFVEYIPVAVITIPEEELASERSVIAPQNEKDQLNAETKSAGEEHQVNNETKSTEDEVSANAANKTAQEEDHESQSPPESQQQEEQTTTPSPTEAETSSSDSPKSKEQTTLSPIASESTTQAHAAVIEETTNAFNKFENTIKTLIEQEKLKQQEEHLSTLETSHQETTTLAPNSQTFTTAKEESNTLVPQDETTMLPKKFEEELQMAVKALEETTHHHFEEFQNNLKEAFKKFTVWGAEHERQGETTTNKNNIEETTQNSTEQPTTIKAEEDSASTTEKVVETPLTEEEEPHRIGAINQNFVDRFSDNYQENTQMSATEEQKKEEESTLTSEPSEREQTTEITFTLTTTMSPIEDEEDGKGTQKQVGMTYSAEHSTTQNVIEENQTPTAESIVKGSTEEAAETTESIPETTIMPILARVPLHRDITSISLTTAEESATETPTHNEAATQPLETEQLKETHTELTQTQTAQPTEREQETITLLSPASNPQEMVTFIEQHEDTTTVRHADEEEETTKEIEEENTAKSQTQEPLTQAAFMEEQQQQIESTTEHEAQTQTAAASGQTTATTTNIEEDTATTQEQLAEQQTTETEIYSTTVVEKEEDETTVAAITSTAAAAAVEPEPRSLSLPPPKLEYLQNEDGVEIFYGYSIVKHN